MAPRARPGRPYPRQDAGRLRRRSRTRTAAPPLRAKDTTDGVGVVDRGEHGTQRIVGAVASEGAARREGARLRAVEHQEDVVQLSRRRVDDVRDSRSIERQLLVATADEHARVGYEV